MTAWDAAQAWPAALPALVAAHGAVVRVTVVAAGGSTPREIGTAMWVTGTGILGTIGGGTLEFDAIRRARAMLAAATPGAWPRSLRRYPLGPTLGQCCGGMVSLLFEQMGGTEAESPALCAHDLAPAEKLWLARPVAAKAAPRLCAADADGVPASLAAAMRRQEAAGRPAAVFAADWFAEPLGGPRPAVFLYGAGHVGREVVAVMAGLELDLTWVDVAADRFPDPMPATVTPVVAVDPVRIAAAAPARAHHLVMTHAHALDLDVCHALLVRDAFDFLGLIGSATKKARFLSRLESLGIDPARRARLVCPIGLPGLKGKHPRIIAVSVTAQLLQLWSDGV